MKNKIYSRKKQELNVFQLENNNNFLIEKVEKGKCHKIILSLEELQNIVNYCNIYSKLNIISYKELKDLKSRNELNTPIYYEEGFMCEDDLYVEIELIDPDNEFSLISGFVPLDIAPEHELEREITQTTKHHSWISSFSKMTKQKYVLKTDLLKDCNDAIMTIEEYISEKYEISIEVNKIIDYKIPVNEKGLIPDITILGYTKKIDINKSSD